MPNGSSGRSAPSASIGCSSWANGIFLPSVLEVNVQHYNCERPIVGSTLVRRRNEVRLAVRRLLKLLRLGPTPDDKDVEIAVLRHQLAVLRAPSSPYRSSCARHARKTAPVLVLGHSPRDASDAHALASGSSWRGWTYPHRNEGARSKYACGRHRRSHPPPRTGEPSLGLSPHRECAKLGVTVSATSVRNVLRRHRLRPYRHHSDRTRGGVPPDPGVRGAGA